MKIVIHGDAETPGTGGWCYADALREMGHDVVGVPSSLGLEPYASNIAGRVIRRALGRPLEIHRRDHALRLLRVVEAQQAKIVIIQKGMYISGVDVQRLQLAGAWVVNINHDDFFSLNAQNRSATQLRALPSYDFIFATREVNVAEVRPLNRHVEFFPFAYHPQIHRPVSIPDSERPTWEIDVVFVGTWEVERARLLEDLVRAVPARYAIWGGGWENVTSRSPLRPYIKRKDVMCDDMAKAIGGAKIALGFLRKKNRDDYTQRTFEIPACGGLLLAERTSRHRSFFEEGLEAEFFDPISSDELVAKTRALLADDDRRDRIRSAGRTALHRQKHTYHDRVARLLELHAQARASAPANCEHHEDRLVS
jgi:spore maturation protein CgeB